MANQFRVKKGLVVNGSGSTLLDIQGSNGQLVSVTDSNADYRFSVSGSGRFTSGLTVTGSIIATSGITGSDALFTGAITAQTLVVQTVSSSVIYSSGSNTFGNELTNVQQFTGSLRVTGSGDHWILGGYVGIGTSNPSYTFHAVSSDSTIGAFRNSGAAIGQLLVGNTAGDLVFRILASGDSLIHSDTSKYLAFGSNGATERMRITSGSNVLIGTTLDEGYKLDVNGTGRFLVDLDSQQKIATFKNINSTGYTSIAIDRSNNVRYSLIEHSTAGTTDWYVGTAYNSGVANSDYQIGTGINKSDAKLLITTAGELLIGTTSDAGDFKLQISGSTYITDRLSIGTTYSGFALNVNGVAYVIGGDIFLSDGYLVRNASNNSSIAFNTSALSFIGTASFNSGVTAPSFTGSLQGTSSWALNVVNASGVTVADDGTAQGSATFLDFTGVGVSVTVASNTASITIPGGAGAAFPYTGSAQITGSLGVTGSVSFTSNLTVDTDTLYVDAANNRVGIGTVTPSSKLHVSNATSATRITITDDEANGRSGYIESNYSDALIIGTTSGVRSIRFAPDNTTRMTVDVATGNVGIGTTSPGYVLDVRNGAIFVSGSGFSSPATESGYRVKMSENGGVYNDPGIGLDGGAGGSEVMWFNALNGFYFNFGTGGQKITIDSDGDLGIGTTSPSEALHIARTAAISPTINLQTTDSTANGAIQWSNSTNTLIASIGSNYNVADGAGGLEFLTGGANTRMFISSSGLVGIGTTSPVSSLHVYSGAGDTITLEKVNSVPTLAFLGTSTNKSVIEGGDNFNFYTSATSRMFISSSGLVGIGTTGPSVPLEVNATAGGIVRVTRTSVGSGYAQIESDGTDGSLSANNNLNINAGGSTRMFVSASGNVGIGTTTQTARLSVVDSALTPQAAAVLSVSRPNNLVSPTNDNAGLRISDHSSNTSLYITDHSNNPLFIVSGSGNVGIGTTSPATKLQVSYQDTSSELLRLGVGYTVTDAVRGAITWHDGGNITGQIDTRFDGTRVNMYFGSLYNSGYNSTVRMTILGDGNVGIGTTTPNAKLDVNGNAIITGSLNVTQGITGSSALLTGTLTAQTLVVQTVSSSVVYSSGSNTFGNELSNTQQFTGSVSITGSLSLATGVASLTSSWAQNAVSSSYPIAVTGSSLISTYSHKLQSVSTIDNIFLGIDAGNQTIDLSSAQRSVLIGYQAATGSYNSDNAVSIGTRAGGKGPSGDGTAEYSVNIGYQAGYNSLFNVDNVYIGQSTGESSQASNSVMVGSFSGLRFSGSLATFFGYDAGSDIQNLEMGVASVSQFIVAVGTSAAKQARGLFRVAAVGDSAARSARNFVYSVALGDSAGNTVSRSRDDNFIGTSAGSGADSISYSNFIGTNAGRSTFSASYSNLIGYQAGYKVASATSIGTNNIIIGTNITLAAGAKDAVNIGAIIFATGSYSTTTGNPFSGSVGGGRVGINVVQPNYNLDVSGSGNYTNGLTVTGSLISPAITGSLQGTASWAQNAVTASYVTGSIFTSTNLALSASYALTASFALNGGGGGLATKAGSVANTSFSGNPRKATVTFSAAFPDTNYAITVTGEDSRTWTIESKLAGSFVINANSNVGLTGTTYWIATAYGETT